MASTSTGPKRNLIASALGKDGLPARYNANRVLMASALIITITSNLSSIAKICDSVESKLGLFWGQFCRNELFLSIFIPLPLQGSFDKKMCQSLHSINPYSSRETRVIFSTWNLDHRLPAEQLYLNIWILLFLL